MGETAKVLCPDKKVLVPDMAAGCSLADSCPADEFAQFVKEHPEYTVISYVNTTAAVKAVTDVVVTSTNARQIVESFPKDEKIIFGPDRNLGNYINSVTGRNMLLWNGACHVHEQFSVEKIVEIKREHPDAVILAHPECKGAVLKLADVVNMQWPIQRRNTLWLQSRVYCMRCRNNVRIPCLYRHLPKMVLVPAMNVIICG